jgi:cytochrome bd ubiquinol oxidase subunit II
MAYIVIFFLWTSLLVYLVMGGADYGSGVLELFATRKHKAEIRKNAYRVMGPIWEANHMWLIIAVVILFVGFPQIYSTVSIYLHLPLLALLLGIIARGTSLAFRNYDAVQDSWQAIYNRIFVYSSFITPFFLGVIASSAVSGRIDPASGSFFGAYVNDWFSGFSLATGFFTVALCGFLSAVYLIGEVEIQAKRSYIYMARMMGIALWIGVVLVFITASSEGIPLTHWVFGDLLCLVAAVFAVCAFVGLWVMIRKEHIKSMRFCAGVMVTMMLIAVTHSHYPDVILLKGGGSVSLLDPGSARETMSMLAMALLGGGLLIVPSLAYLLYSFDKPV